MKDLDDELTVKFTEETTYQHSEIKRGNDRMQMLEELLNKEKEDRIESLDTQLEPINQQIDKGFQDLDDERSSRVNKEREILELLQDEATIVENHITTEQEGR